MGRSGTISATRIFARWQHFYKKGLIDRRTFVKATMVWAGGATMGASLLAACGGEDDRR